MMLHADKDHRSFAGVLCAPYRREASPVGRVSPSLSTRGRAGSTRPGMLDRPTQPCTLSGSKKTRHLVLIAADVTLLRRWAKDDVPALRFFLMVEG